MTKKEKIDRMRVQGITNPGRDSLYWDLKGDKTGIFYCEDKVSGLLFREILPQDTEILREMGEVAASEQMARLYGIKYPGRKMSDEEIFRIIRKNNPENGYFSIAVFDMNTADFLCIIDIESISTEEGRILLGKGKKMAQNQVMRRKIEPLVKRRLNSILIDSWVFPNGCKEKVWNGFGYKVVPIE